MRKLLFFLMIFLVPSLAWAVVTESSLTGGGSSTNAASYTTASIAPTANRLVLATVVSNRLAGASAAPTLSGNSLTWVQVDTQVYSINWRVTVFRAMGSPASGTVTIDFASTGQDNCSWSIAEFAGVDTTGTNGSNAVGTSVKGTVASQTSITLSSIAFRSSNDGTYSGFGLNNNIAITPRTNWTEIHEQQVTDGAASQTCETQWISSNDTSASCSWTGNQNAGGIAFSIRVSTGGIAINNATLKNATIQ